MANYVTSLHLLDEIEENFKKIFSQLISELIFQPRMSQERSRGASNSHIALRRLVSQCKCFSTQNQTLKQCMCIVRHAESIYVLAGMRAVESSLTAINASSYIKQGYAGESCELKHVCLLCVKTVIKTSYIYYLYCNLICFECSINARMLRHGLSTSRCRCQFSCKPCVAMGGSFEFTSRVFTHCLTICIVGIMFQRFTEVIIQLQF